MLHALAMFFQAVDPAVNVNPLTALLVTLLPIAAGWLGNLAMDGLKQIITKIDALPVVVTKIIAAVVAFLVGLAASKFGVALDPDFHLWTAGTLTAAISVFVSAGLFRWKQKNQLARAGVVTATSVSELTTPARVAETQPAVPSNR